MTAIVASSSSKIYYFLDWRPVGGMPVFPTEAVRMRNLSYFDIKPVLVGPKGRTLIAIRNASSLERVTVLARPDGVMVLELQFDARFDDRDLLQYARVIAMRAKEKLDHVHVFHDHIKVHTPAFSAGTVLQVFPVQLEPEPWTKVFQKKRFTNADLVDARCVPSRRAPGNEEPRNALVCLRRGYWKVLESLSGHLVLRRGRQIKWQRSLIGRLVTLLYGAGAVLLVYALLLGSSYDDFLRPFTSPRTIPALIIIGFFGWAGAFFLGQILRFDLPRIKILRAAQGFFRLGNPLNRVMAQVGICSAETGKVDDFTDVIDALKVRTEGEMHRAAMKQLWVTLAVASTGILLASLSIRTDFETKASAAVTQQGTATAAGKKP